MSRTGQPRTGSPAQQVPKVTCMAQVSQGLPVDERLDPYRNRVAILARAGHLVGYLLVLTEVSEPGGVRRSRRQGACQEAASAYVQFRDGSRHVDSRLAGLLAC